MGLAPARVEAHAARLDEIRARYANWQPGSGQPGRWFVTEGSEGVSLTESLITHEWGHVISRGDLAAEGSRIVEESFYRVFQSLTPRQQKKVIENLSEYGMTNEAEFFAESYVQYVYEPERMNKQLREWLDVFTGKDLRA
jgi:hypothetical protein